MLDGFVGTHRFTVELTMGVLHVYFPTENTWNANAPEWALGLWTSARDQTMAWCQSKSIPFDIDSTAWVEFVTGQAEAADGDWPQASQPPS